MIKKTTPIDERLRSRTDLPTMAQTANHSHEVKPVMGEVRVKVTLTNAVDEALVRRGLLSADSVRHYEADALVDSGAIRSVLPRHVVEQLGLAIVRTTRVTYANDGAEDVDVSEVVGIDINGRRTTEETLVLGSEVLIGQTVLESLDLLVDCANQRVVGNPAHPDQPIIKIKMNFPSRSAWMNTRESI
jgi:clan AA aspartic protease